MRRMEFVRRQRQWSQTQLAYHTQLPQTYISEIERGAREPSDDERRIIGRALGIPPETILHIVVAGIFAPGEVRS